MLEIMLKLSFSRLLASSGGGLRVGGGFNIGGSRLLSVVGSVRSFSGTAALSNKAHDSHRRFHDGATITVNDNDTPSSPHLETVSAALRLTSTSFGPAINRYLALLTKDQDPSTSSEKFAGFDNPLDLLECLVRLRREKEDVVLEFLVDRFPYCRSLLVADDGVAVRIMGEVSDAAEFTATILIAESFIDRDVLESDIEKEDLHMIKKALTALVLPLIKSERINRAAPMDLWKGVVFPDKPVFSFPMRKGLLGDSK